MTEEGGYRVLFVEAIGAHRGMHYYDLALCSALAEQNVDVTLYTCDETTVPDGLSFPVDLAFRGIFGRAPAWLRGLRYARALAHIGGEARDGPAILHVHFFHALPLDYAWLSWMRTRGHRLVITAHDVTPFDAGSRSIALVRRIYRLANHIIVHTESSRAELLGSGVVPPERISVIPHGHYLPYVDNLPSRQEARRHLDLPDDAPTILFFGQIKEVKGLEILLQALPILARDHPAVRLVVAGQVWNADWSRYAALIEQLELQERIHLHLGHIPDHKVASFFVAADVVALPYHHVYQSGVLLMALSYARPVVATRVGGLAEVLEEGKTGLLVPPADPQALARSLDAILADPAAADLMGHRGRALITERYAWPRIASLTRAAYERSLASFQ
ncbi:MAG: glycosyltransferase family 4 protein [Anaerolineae bacterium]